MRSFRGYPHFQSYAPVTEHTARPINLSLPEHFVMLTESPLYPKHASQANYTIFRIHMISTRTELISNDWGLNPCPMNTSLEASTKCNRRCRCSQLYGTKPYARNCMESQITARAAAISILKSGSFLSFRSAMGLGHLGGRISISFLTQNWLESRKTLGSGFSRPIFRRHRGDTNYSRGWECERPIVSLWPTKYWNTIGIIGRRILCSR